MAPSTEQSVVAFTAMVTSASESGVTVISHLTFLPGSSLRTLLTEPSVTVKAWSRTCRVAEAVRGRLAEPQLEGELGAPIVGRGLVVDRGSQRWLRDRRRRRAGHRLLVAVIVGEGHMNLDGFARVCRNYGVAGGRGAVDVSIVGEPLVGEGCVGQAVRVGYARR